MAPSVLWYEHGTDFSMVDLEQGGLAALNALIPPATARASTTVYDSSSDVFYLLTATSLGSVWKSVGGGGAPAGVSAQAFTGAGPYAVVESTTSVTVDPGAFAATLVLPPIAGVPVGREIQITKIGGTGTVALTANGSELLYAGTSSYVLSATGDSVRLTFDGTAWRLIEQEGGPENFTAWVSNAGSDANVGTQASPLATVTEALRRAATVRYRTAILITVMTALGASAFPAVIVPPSGVGESSGVPRIVGVQTQVATGTVASAVAGTATTPMTVSVAGAPWVASEHVGRTLRFTSGALAGQSTGVFDNATSTLTTFKMTAGAPAPGDTFEILANPVLSPTVFSLRGGQGRQMAFENVTISTAFLSATSCDVEFASTTVIGAVAFDSASYLSTSFGAYGLLVASPNPGASAVVLDAPRAQLNLSGLRSASFQSFRDSASIFRTLASGLSRINVMGSNVSISSLYCGSATVAGGTNFVDVTGGNCTIVNASISNVAGGSAISYSTNAGGKLEAVVGIGNAGPAFQARLNSGLQVVSPGTGVTITGTSEVKVGANAPITWATLALGGNTSITDMATANTEMCIVRT